jgi:peptide-methionine (S)-S-oxide reductase
MFWKNHNPSVQCKRQYMSAIFYHDEEQKTLAEESLQEMKSKATSKPITTLVLPAEKFFIAEDYHQKYLLQQHGWLISALDINPGEELNASHVAARLNGFVGGYGRKADFDAEWQKLGLNEKMADYVREQHTRNFRGSS